MRVVDTLKAHLGDATARPGSHGVVAFDLATVYVGLGNKAEALNWLERAVAAHTGMLYLAIDPLYRPLYSEPRFRALLKKIGLPS
jgi:hypothetical protein